MYAKVEEGIVTGWPVTRREVVRALGNVSVPADKLDFLAAQQGFVRPDTSPAPQYNPLIERLVLTDPYVNEAGKVVRDYVIEPLQYTASQAEDELKRLIEEAGQQVVAAYPQIVREGWPEKLREARTLAADPNAQTEILAAEAAVLGITPGDLAQKVLASASAFAKINGQLSGLLSKYRARIRAAAPDGIGALLAAAQQEIADALATAGIR